MAAPVPDRRGFYHPVTVLEGVQPGQPAYDDELFGPVAPVIRAKDDEDAMRIVNDSRCGLAARFSTAMRTRLSASPATISTPA
ncbi:MAG: aldehyde dehydrogenase family protein [Oceanicaulis sp.]